MTDAEPRRRLSEPLDEGRVEIVDRDGGVAAYDRDSLMVACAGDWSASKPLRIGEPGAADSVLSGAPGYRYRAGDVDIALTRDEMLRLIFGSLTPAEYERLRELYGDFPEIGTDRYDADTGQARQPMVRVPDA